MLLPVLIVIFSLYLMIFIRKRQVSKHIQSEKAMLKAQTADLSDKVYREGQIQGMPEPVQRFFKNVLKDGQPYISSVYVKHDGRFKTALNNEWINIEGEQFFSVEEPGFLWIGKTPLFTVRDMYISGKGQIKIFLLNIFKVFNGKGPAYNQGELLRWLGENVWFPTNLLPGSRLQWSPIDEGRATLTFRFRNQKIHYKVSINEAGEITKLETRRYMGEKSLETWIGKVSCYKEVYGMKIPMVIEAIWKLSDGEHSYAKFNVRKILYK